MDVDIVAIGDCACVAFDSALRGLKVVAIEERDFVRGVSFNLGTSLDFFKKRDAVSLFNILGEQKILSKLAPGIVKPVRLIVLQEDAGSFKQAILLGDVFATDLRLNILLLRRAERLGAVCINHADVELIEEVKKR